jgi:2-oxo-4-hydroxy-4-carboxy--5-ureidoimidazoline (OHCU) decarboxylase
LHRLAAFAHADLLLLHADPELGGRFAPRTKITHEIVDGQGLGGRRLADAGRASNSTDCVSAGH